MADFRFVRGRGHNTILCCYGDDASIYQFWFGYAKLCFEASHWQDQLFGLLPWQHDGCYGLAIINFFVRDRVTNVSTKFRVSTTLFIFLLPYNLPRGRCRAHNFFAYINLFRARVQIIHKSLSEIGQRMCDWRLVEVWRRGAKTNTKFAPLPRQHRCVLRKAFNNF